MTKIVSAAALAATLSIGAAHAGGVTEPVTPAAVIVEDATNTDGHILVPIFALAMILAAVID